MKLITRWLTSFNEALIGGIRKLSQVWHANNALAISRLHVSSLEKQVEYLKDRLLDEKGRREKIEDAIYRKFGIFSNNEESISPSVNSVRLGSGPSRREARLEFRRKERSEIERLEKERATQ